MIEIKGHVVVVIVVSIYPNAPHDKEEELLPRKIRGGGKETKVSNTMNPMSIPFSRRKFLP